MVPQNRDVAMPVHRHIQDAPLSMIDCTLDHDWWAAISKNPTITMA